MSSLEMPGLHKNVTSPGVTGAVREALIRELNRAAGGYVSGGALAKSLGVSRTAVWKHIEALRELGYGIEAVPRLGYRLATRPDRLFPWEVQSRLRAQRLGRRIEHHDAIGSTNQRAKVLAVEGAPEGTVVVAEEQRAGKGRLGRTWISPHAEGIFASVILRPPLPPREAPKLTLLTAAAVQQAIAEACGLKAGIKWPNDLELGGKKVCGILVELGTELDATGYVVVGIGINANLRLDLLPDDVKERATSLAHELGRPVERPLLLATVLDHMEILYDDVLEHGFAGVIEHNRRASTTLGRRVRVLGPREEWEGLACDIDEEGALVVRTDEGVLRRVHSGEVSIRAPQAPTA